MTIHVDPRKAEQTGGGATPIVLTRPMRLPVVREFQPDAVAVEERTPQRLAHLMLYGISLLLAAAILWASLAKIDEIAVARGRLVTTAPEIVVQPLETAILRSLAVQVGDSVKAGQTLAVLDPTFTQADVETVRTKYRTAAAQTGRLEAEIAGVAYRPSDPGDPAQALEAGIFAQRADYIRNAVHNYDEQLARAAGTLARSRSERLVLSTRLDGIREIEGMRQTLFNNETGSKLNYLQARDARLDIEASLVRLDGSIAEAEHDLERTKAQRDAFTADFQRATMESASEARARRDTAAEELKKSEMRRHLVALTAPADGVVLELGQRSTGSVLREAEPLVVIVPTGVPLEAEVMVDSKDVGHVAAGQQARIKFDAFPFQKHGTAPAVIRTISQDAFPVGNKDAPQSQGNAAVAFRARLPLGNPDLRAVPDGFHFIPGMTVQAEILVGRRTVMSYLLYPLLQAMDEGLRER